MQVVHFLATVVIAVNDQPVTAIGNALLRGDLAGNQQHPASHPLVIIREVIHRGDLFVGHDQDMDWGRGVNIPESRHPFVLIDDRGWYFAIYNFGENSRQSPISSGRSGRFGQVVDRFYRQLTARASAI